MYTRFLFVVGLIAAGFLGAQEAPTSVQVTGAVKQALALTADDLAKMSGVVVDGEGDGSGDVGGYGEGGPGGVEAQGKDELATPYWADLMEGCVGAEDLRLIGGG